MPGWPAPSTIHLLAAPDDPRTAFVFGADAFAAKTVDGGATWTPLPIKTAYAWSLAVGSAQTLYIHDGRNIVVSHDGGATFQTTTMPLANSAGASVIVDPQDPLTAYVSPDHGLYRTRDGGTTWTALADKYRFAWVVLDPQHPEIIYGASPDAGMLKSVDRGDTWQLASYGFPLGFPTAFVQVAPKQIDTVYAGLSTGLFRTTGDGQWSRVLEAPALWNPDSSWVVFDDKTVLLTFQKDSSFQRTVDGGATWTTISAPGPGVLELLPAPGEPDGVYATSYVGGTFHSADRGATWTSVPVPLATLVDFFRAAAGGVLYAGLRAGSIGVSDDLHVSRDAGKTWTLSPLQSPQRVFPSPDDPKVAYAVGADDSNGPLTMHRTTDGGATWQALHDASGNALFGTVFFAPDAPKTIFLAGSGHPLESLDGGDTWTALDDFGVNLAAVASSKVLYASTTDGVFQSTTGGL
jgi:photosystem II stability/assembly factor-like uncharacterized protein